ncbi:MAG: hypothetical protein JNM99_18215 [Verrucomicrobiaceae bacterium]|nr:hypothetical protein [Verrucomicrobiaceae bacterium]
MALFRYLTFEGGLATLKNGTLKLTPPREFNDPFDMHPSWRVEPSEEMLQQFYVNEGYAEQGISYEEFKIAALNDPNAYRQAAQTEVYAGMNKDFGAVCFSRRKDSIPMWGYYCSDQTGTQNGMVVEFDETHDGFRQAFGPWLHDVRYVFTRQAFTNMGGHDFSIFYTKCLQWSHEAEARLIHPLKWDGVTEGHIGDRRGWFLEYPKASVKTIYFGIQMKSEDKRVIAGGLQQWGFSDVRLMELHPHPDHFSFEQKAYQPSQDLGASQSTNKNTMTEA